MCNEGKPTIMRIKLIFIVLSICSICNGQENEKISLMTFIQTLNGNHEEAIFYYQNNRKIIGEMALKKGYIESFQILETPYSEDAPFHIILITTFKNKEEYDNREKGYNELIKEKGHLELMNDKKPDEFRKVLFKKRMVKHLN